MIKIEVTDTFGGEANYSWVRRYQLENSPESLTPLQIVRRAKSLGEWNGLKCKREDYGDMIVLKPFGICQVMFITFE